MGKKDNFNKAMFDMFGIGTDANEEAPEYEKTEGKKQGGLTDDAAVRETVKPAAPTAAVAERTYIGLGTVIEGNINSRGDVEIIGELKGDITADGKVTLHTSVVGNVKAESLTIVSGTLTGNVSTTGSFVLNPDSAMDGNIIASDVFCSGIITGNLDVKGTLMLEETAIINGDIKTGFMSMSRGAAVRGKVEINT